MRVAVTALVAAMLLAACGSSSPQAAPATSSSSSSSTTSTTSAPCATGSECSPALTFETPHINPTENRSSKGTPMGLVCWTFGETAISYIIGAIGSIDADEKYVPADAAKGLARLDALLVSGAEDVTAVEAELPTTARPFAVQLAADLTAVRSLRATQTGVSAADALAAVYPKYFDAEHYDGAADFRAISDTDPHCKL